MNAIAAMTTIDDTQPLPAVGALPIATTPLPIATACRALGLSRATWYRYQSGQISVKPEQAVLGEVKPEQAVLGEVKLS